MSKSGIWREPKTYIFLLLPILTGYVTSALCPIGKTAGSKINSRPPSWLFGVIWPILYIFLGLIWIILRNKNKTNNYFIDILMLVNILCLVSWIIFYGCKKDKKGGLYVLLITFCVSLTIFGYSWSVDKSAGILITPYLTWITFAMMLNFTEVNNN